MKGVVPPLLAAWALTALTAAICASFGNAFLGNFTWFWGPPALILLVLAAVAARPSSIMAAAVALALFLAGYYVWSKAVHPRDGLVWVGYLFAMPGGLVGALVPALLLKSRQVGPVRGGLMTAVGTAAGLALAFAAVTSS